MIRLPPILSLSPCRTTGRAGAALLCVALLCVALLWLLGSARAVQAQAPLFLIDDDTQVRGVTFTFTGTQTFEADRLLQQIATQGPTAFDRIKGPLPFLDPAPHPFSPVELQKDVARLRQFYNRNGFLSPSIDYISWDASLPSTRLDTASNTVRVAFTIDEGPPLIIQDVGFFAPDSASYAVSQFEGRLREQWIRFRDRTAFRTGERYTDFARTRIEDSVLNWLQNQGFAFTRIGADVDVDSTYNTADIQFYVDAGPQARISEIVIDGNTSLDDAVVRRELPFETGDLFSADELSDGQRELFGLNLFRVALAEVPSQPRDSSVSVRYTVREGPLRLVTAQPGYARTKGATAQGQWTHRNFLGGGRQFSVDAVAETGFGEQANDLTLSSKRYRGSLSLRQPYLFSTKLSGIVSPFAQYEQNPLLRDPTSINTREFGLSTTLVYEPFPFRTVSLQHTFSRVKFLGDSTVAPPPVEGELPATVDQGGSLFNKSVLSLTGTVGQSDDYVNPTRGYLLRPFAEFGGGPLGRGVQYFKLGGSASAYTPVTDAIDVAGRITAGRLLPFGNSRGRTQEITSRFEDRFDPIRFYAGGGSDVRGWSERLAGEKFARPVILIGTDTTGAITQDTTDYLYEAEGGEAKLAVNAEVRLPFPGLGASWGTALFFDAGQVSDDIFNLSNMRYGTGVGLRYQTPVGYLRLDLAYKLNPDDEDLRDPREVYFLDYPAEAPSDFSPQGPSNWRRFRLHFSIGQSF